MKNHLRFALSLFLIGNFLIPNTAFSSSSIKPQSIAIFPVVTSKNSTEGQIAIELAQALSKDLQGKFNIIEQKVVSQVNQKNPTAKLTDEYHSYYKKLNVSKEKYTLNGNAKEALVDLNQLSKEILNANNFNQQLSLIYESVELSKAWIYYKSGQKDLSAEIIKKIKFAKSNHTIDTIGFPTAYRKFINESVRASNQNLAKININTTPRSVDVFINGIYAGDSATPLSVPAGENLLILSSHNRKSHKEILRLAENESKTINKNLKWLKAVKKSSSPDLPHDPLEQISLTSALNNGVSANKVVLLNVMKSGSGYTATARVYDQEFHQALETITYPKNILNLKNDSVKAHTFFRDRINKYLKLPANQLWKGDFNKTVVLDDRIAMRPSKPIYKKPAFWAVLGGVVVTGVVLGLTLTNHGSSSSGTGSVVVDISGFSGVKK